MDYDVKKMMFGNKRIVTGTDKAPLFKRIMKLASETADLNEIMNALVSTLAAVIFANRNSAEKRQLAVEEVVCALYQLFEAYECDEQEAPQSRERVQ